jgi:hypothetical protein
LQNQKVPELEKENERLRSLSFMNSARYADSRPWDREDVTNCLSASS